MSASLDDTSERIVRYLNDRGISINVLCFQVFADPAGQLISRAWLLDPVQSQPGVVTASKGPQEPWNGEFYASFGAGPVRSWAEAVKYRFISGGGGPWYSRTLQLAQPGDRVWVRIPQAGYVGVGVVAGEPQRFSEFRVQTEEGPRLASEVLNGGSYHRDHQNDPENAEYFLPVRWLQTRDLPNAINEIGLFGNQNTVCKPITPKWRHTVDRLKELMPRWSDDDHVGES